MIITIIAVSVSALSQIQIFQKEYAKNTRRMQLILQSFMWQEWKTNI